MNRILIFLLCVSFSACAQNLQQDKVKAQSLIDKAYSLIYKVENRDKKLDSSVMLLDQAIALDTSRSLSYQLKSTVLVMQGKKDLAIEPISMWLKHHPNDLEFLMRRSLIYHRLKKEDLALKDFTTYRKLTADKANIVIRNGMTMEELKPTFTIAVAYFLMGDKEKATKLLTQIEAVVPNEPAIKGIVAKMLKEDREATIYSMVGF